MMAVQRCICCVLSDKVPGITFDETGKCSFCRDTVYFTSEQAAVERARLQVAEFFSQKTRPYDAILCNSGGKDSSYTLKLAVKQYGLKVLSFTLDNGFIPQQTFSNIRAVVDSLGVDHVTIRPSFKFMSAVIRASALLPIYSEKSRTRISSGCNSCISLVNTTALKIALEKKIPFILAGFTLGQIPTNGIIYRNHFRFFADSRKESLERLRQAVGSEVNDYYSIPDHILDSVESYPHNINLLCLENITEKEIVSQIKTLGWEQPQNVDGCSSNCTLNTFNNYVHRWQYGYNPYEFELSQLIRKGLMSREEALEKIQDQPIHMLPTLAEKLGFSLEDQQIMGIK